MPIKFSLKILSPRQTVKVVRDEVLADVLRSSGIPLSLDCGGRGICGKCFVEIIRGDLPSPGEEEEALIRRKGLPACSRLACLYKIHGDVTVRIPAESLLGRIPVLDAGLRVFSPLDPAVKKYALEIPSPPLSDPVSLAELIERRFRKRFRFSLAAVRDLPRFRPRNGRRVTITVFDDREIVGVESGDTTGRAYGAAVDIGTSTVVAELIDLVSGRSLGRAAAVNNQARFGADIVSRIAFAFLNPDNGTRLSEAIRSQIGGLIRDLVRTHRVSPKQVYDVVIAGNTAMNHFFLGVPATTLAMSPFHGVFGPAPEARAADLGFAFNAAARVYTAPNIKSFVGGDVAAGLAALDIAEKEGNFLFIDLGTNGEIVLKKGRRTTATSTAAGPAFEGMTISCGMPAIAGAVCAAGWTNGFRLRTIENRPALGVCGTGLIDILAISLKRGLVAPDGRIRTRSKTIRITGRLILTQPDIRRIQLAVAAVKSGVKMMLEKEKISLGGLNKIFVGGSFGSSLNVGNAMAIGLLPAVPRDKVVFVGNSSLAGARKLLLCGPERRKIESFVRTIRHLSLAGDRAFEQYFLKALEFGPYSGGTP